jgi:site-specific DNA-methyltransferase (adenine-specific)
VRKCSEESKNEKIVLLIPARTDTRYFHDYIYRKPNVHVEFLRGRLKFERGGVALQSSPFPSMLVTFDRGK